MIGRFLCRIGLHDWAYRWYVPTENAFRRKCRRCHKVATV